MKTTPLEPSTDLDFKTFLRNARPQIEAALDSLVPPEATPPERIHEAMRYSLFAGGKRVRPALVLLAGDSLGLDRSLLLPGGAALEMIHTYSLIHDDLPALDNDDLRRGRPTAHRRFDEATAILAGDALLTLGLTTLATYPAALDSEARRRAAAEVGTAIGTLGMIGGQVDDLAAEDHWPTEPAKVLERIHRRKTGALLIACVRLPGIYSNASEEDDRILTELGERIGLLFQIADDILDVEGSSSALGKTAGKDAASRKLTYPGLYGLAESKKLLYETRDEALAWADRLPRGSGLFPSLIEYLTARKH